jgi:hypothetical protein
MWEIIRENHAAYTVNAENSCLKPLRTQRSLRENDLRGVILNNTDRSQW